MPRARARNVDFVPVLFLSCGFWLRNHRRWHGQGRAAAKRTLDGERIKYAGKFGARRKTGRPSAGRLAPLAKRGVGFVLLGFIYLLTEVSGFIWVPKSLKLAAFKAHN